MADNLGAIGQALGLLVIGAIVVLGAMSAFIALAVMMGNATRTRSHRKAKILILTTRVAVLAWNRS